MKKKKIVAKPQRVRMTLKKAFLFNRVNFSLTIVLLFLCTLLIKDYFPQQINQEADKNTVVAQPVYFEATESAKVEDNKKEQEATKTATLIMPEQNGRQVRVPILTYHYIGNNPNPADTLRDNLLVSPDNFEAQMKYLSENGFNTIGFDTLYAALKGLGSLPEKPVILTFDDGYIDFYLNAFPVLRKYNLRAVSFIPVGLMDQGYYLHWDQIKEMDGTGLIYFQAHSVNHANLPYLNAEQLKFEVSKSKEVLQEKLGKPVNFFAYPYGTSNEFVWQAVRDAGFLGAVGTWHGSVESEGTVFNMPRIKIGNYGVSTFAAAF